jgi:predicted MFS family arabinose efflux permease
VANQWQLYLAWVGVGIAMSGTLYQPAFSLLIRRYPQDFRRAIITLTFLGGLASTVFIPLGAWLIESFGWRAALVALGSLHLLICLPIHAYWLRGEPRALVHAANAPSKKLIEFTHHFPFWGLALFFVLFSGITTAVGAHLVSILRERDLPPGWAIAIPASIGLLQVAGRLLLFFTEKHLDIHKANRWIPFLLPAALCTLALGLREPIIAIVFALLYGMANGMITIVKATAMATYVSRERAASLNGLLGLPTALSRAVAPSLLAALWTMSGSYIAGLWAASALGAAAVIAFWVAQRRALG